MDLRVLLYSNLVKQLNGRMKRCPGFYCGRYKLPNATISACGSCPRGYRTDNGTDDICRPCRDLLTFYDWLYLTFMALVPLFYHWYYLDYKVRNVKLLRKLILSTILETLFSGVLSILVMEPRWKFTVQACTVSQISDWYPYLYNPVVNYEHYVHCTQEVVYPLFSIVYVFYFFCVLSIVLIRPLFFNKREPFSKFASSSIHVGLYLFPILGVAHAIFCGVIYYSFPYFVIMIAIASNTVHLAKKPEQSFISLFLELIRNSRDIFIVALHWACVAFGIVGITNLENPKVYGVALCMVPFPTLFYMMTARLTDPNAL